LFQLLLRRTLVLLEQHAAGKRILNIEQGIMNAEVFKVSKTSLY